MKQITLTDKEYMFLIMCLGMAAGCAYLNKDPEFAQQIYKFGETLRERNKT